MFHSGAAGAVASVYGNLCVCVCIYVYMRMYVCIYECELT